MSAFKHVNTASLPSGWKVKFFGDIVSFRMGKTPPRNQKKYWDNGVHPWVSIADMKPFGKILETKEYISEDAHKQVFRNSIIPAGSILMSFKLTIGRVAKLGIPAYHNEAIISFLPGGDVDADYLFFHLAHINYKNYQDTAVKGQTLNKGKIQKLEIILPPLPEQRKIATILSTVQKAIEQQEQIIQTTTELKKTLMQKLFTEGLRGEKQKKTEIGLVPESWEVVPLRSLAKIGNGSTPKRDNETYWQGGTIPWLNSAKIHDRFITEADQFVTERAIKECHLPRVKPNSLLIAITGQGKTLGNSALVSFETCINQHLAYAQFTSKKVIPDFVLWYMQTRYEHLRSVSQGGGSTKGALTCGYLKTYPVPVPSTKEQQQIADTFTAIDQRMRFHESKKLSLKDLFCALLQQLMTAKIQVHDIELSIGEG